MSQESQEAVDERGRDRFECQLLLFQGQEGINFRTIPGFQFRCGRLMDVEDGTATITDVKVLLPGSDEFFKVNFVTINLCVLTSFGISNRGDCKEHDTCFV
jgi:hypothetical protein